MYEYMTDSFLAKGTDFNEFSYIAKKIDENTELVNLNFNHMVPMHYFRELPDKYILKVLRPFSVFKISNSGVYALAEDASIKKSRLEKLGKEFMNEFTGKNKTLMLFDKKGHYFTSELMSKTFGGKFTAIGGKFLRQSSMERDICFAKLVEQEEMPSGVALVRKADGIPKIFAVYTERYKRTPIHLLADVINELKATKNVRFWTISQKSSEIYFDMPDNSITDERLIPGILLETSDTGYAQTVINLCWREKNSSSKNYFIQESISFKHSTDITLEELISKIKDSHKNQKEFLDKYHKYREYLENRKIDSVRDYQKSVNEFSTNLGFKKMLGLAGEKKLTTWLIDQYNESIKNAVPILDKIIGLDRDKLCFSDNQNNEFKSILPKLVAA